MPISSLSAILAWHCRRYPLLKSWDIYKLVHQGVFGPGHVVAGAEQAKRSLKDEVERLKAEHRNRGRNEELVEPIELRGRLVRVNLRPLLQKERRVKSEERRSNWGEEHRASADLLAEAMVESAARVKGDPRIMKQRLAAAVKWCRSNLPGQAGELERLSARAERSGYPAFHHSAAYTRAYRPAYRVVLSDFVKPHASGRADLPGRPSRAAAAGGK